MSPNDRAAGSGAFEEAWCAYAADVASRCRYLTRRADLADEAFSRVAVLALRGWRGEEISNARAWLLRLARNVCVDLYREACRDPISPVSDLSQLRAARTMASDPETALLRDEAMGVAGQALRDLPERLRTPLLLQTFDGVATGEVAERLGISIHTVRKRVEEAKRHIRRRMTAYSHGRVVLRAERDRSLSPHRAITVRVRREGTPEVEVVLFVTHARSGNVASLKRYLASYPTGWKKRLELARALREAGEMAEAVEEYERVLARSPRLLDAWLELAETLELLGRNAAAHAAYSAAAQECGSRAAPLLLFLRDVRDEPVSIASIPVGFIDDHALLIARALIAGRKPALALQVLARPSLKHEPLAAVLRAEAIAALDTP